MTDRNRYASNDADLIAEVRRQDRLEHRITVGGPFGRNAFRASLGWHLAQLAVWLLAVLLRLAVIGAILGGLYWWLAT